MGTKPVNAVENLVRVLECLSKRDTELGVRELSRRTGLSVPTVHRLCASMEQLGLLVQRPDTQRYALGPRLVQLAATALGQLDVRRAALPHMQRLRDHYQETVSLNMLYGRERVTVEQVLSPRDPIVSVQIGARYELVRGAPGKALLAFVPEELAREAANHTWTELTPELKTIRSRGYAESREELFPGVAAVSAPIFDHTGDPVAVISIVASVARLPLPVAPWRLSALLSACRAVSLELGCPQSRIPHSLGGEVGCS